MRADRMQTGTSPLLQARLFLTENLMSYDTFTADFMNGHFSGPFGGARCIVDLPWTLSPTLQSRARSSDSETWL
ncbi:hypothetical protein PLESTM_000056100 [Pleodorina starrii]|nr:hypothetical protein PLESTM_000056100 [Pleodorina starrii]